MIFIFKHNVDEVATHKPSTFLRLSSSMNAELDCRTTTAYYDYEARVKSNRILLTSRSLFYFKVIGTQQCPSAK